MTWCARLQLTEPALENILWGGAKVKAKLRPSRMGEVSSANLHLFLATLPKTQKSV